jgi:hypothetical protein
MRDPLRGASERGQRWRPPCTARSSAGETHAAAYSARDGCAPTGAGITNGFGSPPRGGVLPVDGAWLPENDGPARGCTGGESGADIMKALWATGPPPLAGGTLVGVTPTDGEIQSTDRALPVPVGGHSTAATVRPQPESEEALTPPVPPAKSSPWRTGARAAWAPTGSVDGPGSLAVARSPAKRLPHADVTRVSPRPNNGGARKAGVVPTEGAGVVPTEGERVSNPRRSATEARAWDIMPGPPLLLPRRRCWATGGSVASPERGRFRVLDDSRPCPGAGVPVALESGVAHSSVPLSHSSERGGRKARYRSSYSVGSGNLRRACNLKSVDLSSSYRAAYCMARRHMNGKGRGAA